MMNAASASSSLASPSLTNLRAPDGAEAAGPGKKAAAVGQQAKAAVAAAREAGIELPKNAQGLAASQIAKGADPASIFLAAVAETPETDETAGAEATDGVAAETAEEVVAGAPEEAAEAPIETDAGQVAVTDAVTDAASDGYSAAVAALFSNIEVDQNAPLDVTF